MPDNLETEHLRAVVAACHHAVGESEYSEDDGLADGIATRLKDMRERLKYYEDREDALNAVVDAARAILAYETTGRPHFVDWDGYYTRLRSALSALDGEQKKVP